MSDGDTSIRPSAVPAYLRSGTFYLSLDESHDEEISVPADVLKGDLSITNQADLDHILSSLRFWGVDNVPYEVFDYLLVTPELQTDKFDADYPVLASVIQQRELENDQHRMSHSVEYNNMYLIDYYIAKNCSVMAQDVLLAVEKGHIDIVKRFKAAVVSPDKNIMLWRIAFRHGQMECLHYFKTFEYDHSRRFLHMYEAHAMMAYTSVPNFETLMFAIEVGCSIDARFLPSAAWRGDLRAMQFAHEKGFAMTKNVGYKVVESNDLPCCQYYIEQGGVFSASMVKSMSKAGWLEGLKYAFHVGCEVDRFITAEAAEADQLECLQLLHKRGCPWDHYTTRSAVSRGSLRCLQYACDHGCPVEEDALNAAPRNKRADIQAYLHSLELLKNIESLWNIF